MWTACSTPRPSNAPSSAACRSADSSHCGTRHAGPNRTEALILVSTPGPRWKLKPHLVRYMKWPTLSSPLFFAGAFGRFWPELRVTYPDLRERGAVLCSRDVSRACGAGDSVADEPTREARSAGAIRIRLRPRQGADARHDRRARSRSRGASTTRRWITSRVIQGARFQLLERTGHLGIVSAPDRFASIVSRFYRTL